MKIALITETFPPEINGVAMTLHRVVEGLTDRGHEVEVICPRREDRLQFFSSAPFHLHMVPGLPIPKYPELRFGLPAGGVLKQAWTKDRPDLVHIATEGPLGWSAQRITERLGIPTITTFHTNFHRYGSHYGFGIFKPLIFWWLRRMRRHALRTFVPSEELKAELEKEGFQRLSILSRGVDTELFGPHRRSEALRASWSVDPETPVAIYVGRLAPEKNLPLTIRAYEVMRRILPTLRLVLVGDGPERANIERTHPEIILAGPRRGEDLAAHYASGDIFPFASITETFGNVITEAMASGLVVVSYDYAAARKHMRNGVNGVTVPINDEVAYLAAITLLARQPELWPGLRTAAHQTAASISWNAILDQFNQEILSLVPTVPSPRP